MASGTLAKQYIEFVAKGLDTLENGLEMIRGNLTLTDAAGKTLGDHINANFAGMAAQLVRTKAEIISLQGSMGKTANEAAILNNQLALTKKQAELVDLRTAMNVEALTGASVELSRINSELEKVARLAAIQKMENHAKALEEAINSGAYAKWASEMLTIEERAAGIAKHIEALHASQRVTVVPSAIPIPVASAAPNQVLQQMEANLKAVQDRTYDLDQAIKSGAFGRMAGDLSKANNELERMQKAAAWEQLKASKGTFGAWADYIVGKTKEIGTALTDRLGAALSAASMRIQQSIASPVAIGAAVAGFQMLTNAAHSWVNAGLQGTAHGNLMSMMFQQMSQQIAGIFVPTINLVIQGLRDLTYWFRSLTGDQQDSIRRWIEAAAVMVTVSTVMGRLGSVFAGVISSMIAGVVSFVGTALSTIIPAIVTLTTAGSTAAAILSAKLALATAGISLVLGAIGMVVSLLISAGIAGTTMGAGILVGTQSGRAALSQLLDSFRPIITAVKDLAGIVWRTLLSPILEGVASKLGAVLQTVGGWISTFVSRVGPIIGVVFEAFMKIALRGLPRWRIGRAHRPCGGVCPVTASACGPGAGFQQLRAIARKRRARVRDLRRGRGERHRHDGTRRSHANRVAGRPDSRTFVRANRRCRAG